MDDMDDRDGLLEEYKSLREEIMRRQDARLVILGFTVAGIGAVIGLTVRGGTQPAEGLDRFALALIGFSLAMLSAAIVLTIRVTQQIELIGAYIRIFIEPKTSGIRFQTRWARYRELKRLGTANSLAWYYGFLTIAVYSMSFPTGLHEHPSALVLLSMLAAGALACSFDLHERKTKGWKIDWSAVDK